VTGEQVERYPSKLQTRREGVKLREGVVDQELVK